MREIRRPLTILLMLAMLLPCLLLPAQASEPRIVLTGTCGAWGDNLTWSLDSDGALTISGAGAMQSYNYDFTTPWYAYSSQITSVNLPDGLTSIGSYAFERCTGLTDISIPASVVRIEETAFFGCTGLTSIIIPDGVLGIGSAAFGSCTGLTCVSLPSSVKRISRGVFRGCTGLVSVTIPDGVTHIESSAFCGCTGLTSVSIPLSVTSIGDAAFFGCTGLTSISIPAGVTDIVPAAFAGCTNLIELRVDAENMAYCNDDSGVLYNKEKTNLVCCPGGFSGVYVIPESVTRIEGDAFSGCISLTGVTIPSSVTDIGWGAFSGCTALAGVLIPSSVRNIGWYAFSGCTGLKGITIPESVIGIGGGAFRDCTGLTSVTIPSRVTIIGDATFANCTGLTSVTIPASVEIIESWAFSGCTGLRELALPERLQGIGWNAFSNCINLTNVTIPASVTGIESYAFFGCTELSGAYFLGNAPKLGNFVFYYKPASETSKATISLAERGFKIYYMPGRSGWTSPTYGEEAYPTALWCGEISCPGAQFTDQPDASNWAHKGLDFCIARGLLSGTSDTTVSPNVTMNRAMLVTVLYSLEGKPEVTAENPFTDVENDRWFSKPVIWAAANGIVSGAGNGKFNPFGNVTREQIAVMLRSYARYKSFDTSASIELSPYPDAGSTSGWAKDALSWAVAEGLISGAASGGATYLNPKNNATRAQVATILMQFVTKVAKD